MGNLVTILLRSICYFNSLKDHSTALVKIADFGLSDFYRPGATMKTNCGTLSFLAPEVFKGTSNAGNVLTMEDYGRDTL